MQRPNITDPNRLPTHEVYIDYLSKDHGFRPVRKSFKDYQSAKAWSFDNLEKFHPDMVKYYD